MRLMEGAVMTITTDRAVVRQMTDQQMRDAIADLLRRAGLTREELGERGDRFQLDAWQRGVLADVEALEWLLKRG